MMTEYISQHPELTALAAIVLGLILASVASRLSVRLIDWAEYALGDFAPSAPIASNLSKTIIRRFAYYATLLIFVLYALRVLGFGGLAGVFDALIFYIPGLIAGSIIIILGYLTGAASFHLLSHALETETTLLPRLVQVTIVALSVLTGLSQMSVDVSFFGQVILALIVLSLGGIALAFALGSRDYVANQLAKRQFRQFQIGEQIRIDQIEGRLVEFTDDSLVLETKEGLAMVPAKVLNDTIVVKLTSQ